MWVVSTNARPLHTQEKSNTCSTGGWVGLGAGLVGSGNLAPPGYDPRTVQLVASHCTKYVKPGRIGDVLVKIVYQYGLHCSLS